MRFRGWLLEPHLSGRYASLWFKTVDGEVVRVKERHYPRFLAEPRNGYTVDNVKFLFDEHPDVHETGIVERHPDLGRRLLERYVEVKAYSISYFEKVLRYAERLPEVEEVYNTGLIPIQWYLIHKDVAPSNLCEVEEADGLLKGIKVVDDHDSIEPPPYETILFEASDPPITKINVYNERQFLVSSLRGEEAGVIRAFQNLIRERDPDVIVTDCPITTVKRVVGRAACNAIDFRFGRGGELYHGRVILGMTAFLDSGIAGLVERARFTLAPLGVSADWEAGKTIDSRQCYAAARLGAAVPKMKGGFAYSSTAWDAVRRDRGGMLFSPVAGLHENVACIDFESMFPNIIVRKNVSYETVTAEGVDASIQGFMGLFTAPFLGRRLRLKRLKARYIPGSPEWWLCHRRQSALKLMLVVVYGYSGCYANRFANVRVFQEINRQARVAMVKALNICLENGFEVVYGDTDSLFVKRPGAGEGDYRGLASEISEAAGLPMGLDRHFRYLVLLTRTTDPRMVVARRYYGRLTDGSLYYRGIELRRHDTPPFIKEMQTRMMETLLDAESPESVLKERLPESLEIARRAIDDVRRGRVDPRELVISKRLRKDLKEYRARQPHIVAAMLGADEDDEANYVLVNTGRRNPYLRVMPAFRLDAGHRRYDRKKYAEMTRRAAWNLLRPFVQGEDSIGGSPLKAARLDAYV